MRNKLTKLEKKKTRKSNEKEDRIAVKKKRRWCAVTSMKAHS